MFSEYCEELEWSSAGPSSWGILLSLERLLVVMLVWLVWLLVAVERVDWVVDTLLGKEDILC